MAQTYRNLEYSCWTTIHRIEPRVYRKGSGGRRPDWGLTKGGERT